MGNQIKFQAKDKKETISSENTLEIENIQLRNTNRKLISKLDQQKQLIKKLNREMESIKKNKELVDINTLNKEYQKLKNKNENLETLLIQSKKEISKLKKELDKTNNGSGNSPWDKLKKIRK